MDGLKRRCLEMLFVLCFCLKTLGLYRSIDGLKQMFGKDDAVTRISTRIRFLSGSY